MKHCTLSKIYMAVYICTCTPTCFPHDVYHTLWFWNHPELGTPLYKAGVSEIGSGSGRISSLLRPSVVDVDCLSALSCSNSIILYLLSRPHVFGALNNILHVVQSKIGNSAGSEKENAKNAFSMHFHHLGKWLVILWSPLSRRCAAWLTYMV